MTLDLLDLLLISHFCFSAPVPWWLWVFGILASIGGQVVINKLVAGLTR